MATKKKKPGTAGVVTNLGYQGNRARPSRVPDGAPGPLSMPPPGRVKLRTQNGKFELVARLGEDPASLTPQVPRIEQVEVPWRASQSQWLGQAPAELTISMVLDAYPWGSIEGEWETLEDMARPVQAGRSESGPSPLQIAGSVPGQDRWWQISEVEQGDAIWMRGGYRARVEVSLTLTQWLPVGRTAAGARKNPRTSTGSKKRRSPWTVNHGESLTSIALRALGDASRWKDIAKLNKHKNGKTRKTPDDLKVGERLKLPQG